jgi:hypothetical protein
MKMCRVCAPCTFSFIEVHNTTGDIVLLIFQDPEHLFLLPGDHFNQVKAG